MKKLVAPGTTKTKRRVLDAEGIEVTPGCKLLFSYGIPPVRVRATVVERDGALIALSPSHTPAECNVRALRKYVGEFWVERRIPRRTALLASGYQETE